MHPYLDKGGWDYQELCVWNKGVSHIAGNVNSKTIRGVPVVTEVCARYTRRVFLADAAGDPVPLKQWVRSEWERSGVPLARANEACGVKNAATRKYMTKDGLWYFPPPEMMVGMAEYLAAHGRPSARPYFSLDGTSPLSAEAWRLMRAKWNHVHGVTNVFDVAPLHGRERLRHAQSGKALHYNQKPMEIVDHLIAATTDPGEMVWDPFAGLATVGVAANRSARRCYCSEISAEVYASAAKRLRGALEVRACLAS